MDGSVLMPNVSPVSREALEALKAGPVQQRPKLTKLKLRFGALPSARAHSIERFLSLDWIRTTPVGVFRAVEI